MSGIAVRTLALAIAAGTCSVGGEREPTPWEGRIWGMRQGAGDDDCRGCGSKRINRISRFFKHYSDLPI